MIISVILIKTDTWLVYTITFFSLSTKKQLRREGPNCHQVYATIMSLFPCIWVNWLCTGGHSHAHNVYGVWVQEEQPP